MDLIILLLLQEARHANNDNDAGYKHKGATNRPFNYPNGVVVREQTTTNQKNTITNPAMRHSKIIIMWMSEVIARTMD